MPFTVVGLVQWIERGCLGAVQASLVGTLPLVGLFIGYLAIGFTLLLFATDPFPYPFLALHADPVFNLLSFLLAASICLGTGGLIILYMVNGMNNRHDKIALLASLIGFGFGAAIISVTRPTVLSFLGLVFGMIG